METFHYFEYGEQELVYLRKKDKKLGAAIDRIGMIKREVNPDLFSALVESIIGQQISAKAAITVCGKLDALCGMNAEKLHALSIKEIQSCDLYELKALSKINFQKYVARYAPYGSVTSLYLWELAKTV